MLESLNTYLEPATYIVSRDHDISALETASWKRWWNGKRVILPRALCKFHCMDIQQSQKKSVTLRAIDLHVRNFSPYDNVGMFIRLDRDFAQVWSWDAEPLVNLGVSERNCIPESAFRYIHDGLLELKCIEGYEAQLWSNGSLRASRWWVSQPDARDWAIFASESERFSGEGGNLEPEYVDLDFTKDFISGPHTRRAVPITRYRNILDFKELAITIIVILSLPFLFQLGRWWSLQKIEKRLSIDVARLQDDLGSKRVDINTVQKLLIEFDGHTKKLDYPDILPALSDAASILSSLDANLVKLRVSDGSLSINFKSRADVDQVELVQELEESPYLLEALILPGRAQDEWTVEARIDTIKSNSPPGVQ